MLTDAIVEKLLTEFDFVTAAEIFEQQGWQYADIELRGRIPDAVKLRDTAKYLLTQIQKNEENGKDTWVSTGRFTAYKHGDDWYALEFTPLSSEYGGY